MKLADIRAELEEDRTWRMEEIRRLRNQLAALPRDRERDRFRRCIVVMLYAHYEGFVKFAMQQYINAVNRERISVADATAEIVAAAWSEVFSRLENPQRRCQIFRKSLPDDTQLHRFARRRDFVEQIDGFNGMPVELPDQAVDVESNLTPTVLRKNLFRLGLGHDRLAREEGNIHHLLQRRHAIAHGAERSGIGAAEYARVEGAAFRVMEAVMEVVMDSLSCGRFRRNKSAPSRR